MQPVVYSSLPALILEGLRDGLLWADWSPNAGSPIRGAAERTAAATAAAAHSEKQGKK